MTRQQYKYPSTFSLFHFIKFLLAFCLSATFASAAPTPPYPPSRLISSITWHWDTRQTAAPGSDLWPVTWGPDDHLYVAWGDGGGFGGTDTDGRVALGIGRIEDGPEHFRGFNINGGKNPEHPSSFPKKGKTAGLLFDSGTLYANINLQDDKWPNVNHVLAWSTNRGATWIQADWLFAKGPGNFFPARFINFGKNGEGLPPALAGYIYLYGSQQPAPGATNTSLFLSRVPRQKILDHDAYEYFGGLDSHSQPVWSRSFSQARPIFTDPNSTLPNGLVYNPGLDRFLLSSFHGGPGQLGIFESPNPWGPWSTVAYYEDWAGMNSDGEGLTCEFPQKWMNPDGLTLWAVFSAYGGSAKQGLQTHDRFNLVKVTLTPVAK